MLFGGVAVSDTPIFPASSTCVDGISCIRPKAPLLLTASAVNLDSCLITAITRRQSRSYLKEYFLTVSPYRWSDFSVRWSRLTVGESVFEEKRKASRSSVLPARDDSGLKQPICEKAMKRRPTNSVKPLVLLIRYNNSADANI